MVEESIKLLTSEDLARIIYDTQVTFYNALKNDNRPHWDSLPIKGRWMLVEEVEYNLPFGPTDPRSMFDRTQLWGFNKGQLKQKDHYEHLEPELKALADVYNLLLNQHRGQTLLASVATV